MKTIIERVLLDAASILIVTTSVLYSLGVAYSLGAIEGYGITDDLVTFDLRLSILIGFYTLLITPFTSTTIWLFSLMGLVPVFLRQQKKQVPSIVVYIGILLFAILQLTASYEAGEISSKEELVNIAKVYRGEPAVEFDALKLELKYTVAGNKLSTLVGYGLEIPGDYFFIAQKNKIIAIQKNTVTSVIFQTEQ